MNNNLAPVVFSADNNQIFPLVLRILEIVNLKAKNFDEWKDIVTQELKAQRLQRYQKLVSADSVKVLPCIGFLIIYCEYFVQITARENNDYESRQVDHLSHYILRFAYCQSEEYRRWFIAREFELFKLRWCYLSNQDKQKFIEINNLSFTPVSCFRFDFSSGCT